MRTFDSRRARRKPKEVRGFENSESLSLNSNFVGRFNRERAVRYCGSSVAAEKDLLEHLQTALQNWPRAERDIFELYFIEGFYPDEIAMVTRRPLTIVQENIASIQHRLREEMLDEILAALEFPALDSKAFCRIDELAYRKGGSSRHGRA